MSKSEYRKLFSDMKDFIKFRMFLDMCGISRSNFSHFMKGEEYDMFLSIDKLSLLHNSILSYLENIV